MQKEGLRNVLVDAGFVRKHRNYQYFLQNLGFGGGCDIYIYRYICRV